MRNYTRKKYENIAKLVAMVSFTNDLNLKLKAHNVLKIFVI